MLKIKPNCEHCNRDLSADSSEARICSFECTFCSDCVETILHNVCPNCGGGLEKRPIRPKNKFAKAPASTERYHKPVDLEKHAALVAGIGKLAPELR